MKGRVVGGWSRMSTITNTNSADPQQTTMSPDDQYAQNSAAHKLLLKLAPGVILASAAYSKQGDFPTQLYPRIYKSKLITVKTPAIFNDTKVHVALVGEWDDEFKIATRARAAAEVANGDAIPASRPGQVQAHAGFLQSLESVTEYSTFDSSGIGVTRFNRNMPETLEGRTLDRAAIDVLRRYNKKATQHLDFSDLTRVVVVGHSLGAAIATLASVWLRERMPEIIEGLAGKQITCITTGSPRVGNKAFANKYAELVHSRTVPFDCYRVVHNCDVVPSVPLRNWGFRHVGKPIWLRKTHNNWSYVYLTLKDEDPPNVHEEKTARPLGYSGWILDHFEWNYSMAIGQALTTTISPSMKDFNAKEDDIMPIVRKVLNGPCFSVLSLLLWVPAFIVVKIGKLMLGCVYESQVPLVAALYHSAVNVLFAFFTVPMYILTYVTYYM